MSGRLDDIIIQSPHYIYTSWNCKTNVPGKLFLSCGAVRIPGWVCISLGKHLLVFVYEITLQR